MLVDSQHKQGQRYQSNGENFAIVSVDESFLFYNILIIKVWIDREKRPIVHTIVSHKHSFLFGAGEMEGKQLLRKYDKFNVSGTLVDFLIITGNKFPRYYINMDMASPHYRSGMVKDHLEQCKDILVCMYLPTASPESRVIEK